MKKLFALIMVLALAVTMFAACGDKKAEDETPGGVVEEVAASDFDYIKGNGKLVVGMTDYAPMNYKEDGSDEWTGFDTEFALAVAEKLGVEVEFVEIDWDNKFVALSSKSIDCIWNGMTISDEVLNNTSCSKAYVKNAQVVVMKKDVAGKYTSAEDMAELTFAAEAGSAGAAAAEDNGFELVEVGTQTDAILEVQSGSVDACIIDITMANAMVGENTSYADLAQGIELTSEEYGIAFRKDSDMTEKVNALMDELKSDGTLDKLAEKYSLTLAF
ncbi:MAG: transporter substrate-binding domain-containing protein [Clostridia bacterium]|nr:transporter substrate-binding domain-containing protein [Clostridia bacterium]